MTTTTLRVKGMRCAGCVSSVEKAIQKVPGVQQALVNLATHQATIRFDEAKASVKDLVGAIQSTGFDVELPQATQGIAGRGANEDGEEPASPSGTSPSSATTSAAKSPATHEASAGQHHAGHGATAPTHHPDASAATPGPAAHQHEETDDWKKRLLPMGALAIVVVILGMTWHTRSSAWVQLALATPIQLVLGWPFYRGALRGIRYGRVDMDTLVALGTTAAFVYSIVLTVQGETMTYFDTSVVILALIGLGKLLESRARKSAAAAIHALMQLQPPVATVFRNGQEMTIPVGKVRVNDMIRVRPGQRVPVDGVVVEGTSSIDQSMLTGESMPVEISRGHLVYGGTLNQTGAFEFRATRTGQGTLLAQIVQLVEQAQASKAGIQRIADQVAGVFVPVVLGVALLTLLGWGFYQKDWVSGLHATIAVLIVACPCALGLATPTAIMVGTGLGAQHGILIKDAAALERAGKLTHVILDKTGTLTLGRPAVSDVFLLPRIETQTAPTHAAAGHEGDVAIAPPALTVGEVLRLAAGVEQYSEHPLGRAIVDAARKQQIDIPRAEEFRSVTAGGVLGTVENKRVIVGRLTTLRDQGVAGAERLAQQRDQLIEAAKTAVAVAIDGVPVAFIAVADQIKPEAHDAVRALHKLGLKVILMTGDLQAAGQAVAKPLGIHYVFAQVLPQDKQSQVARLQKEGNVVAMVGDGINDAPALAAADIGIAMGGHAQDEPERVMHGGGTDIAMEAGHVVLVGGDLRGLPRAITLSRATMKRIYVGLFWAFCYNLVLIPVAVAGLMSPMFAAGAMALSSVSVVLNALYLKRAWKA